MPEGLSLAQSVDIFYYAVKQVLSENPGEERIIQYRLAPSNRSRKKLILEDLRGLGQAIAIMVNASTSPCAGCHERDRKIADLQAKLIAIEKRLKEVEADLAKAKKNSRNSSKPPSSDIVNAQKEQKRRDKPKKRKIGGQPVLLAPAQDRRAPRMNANGRE